MLTRTKLINAGERVTEEMCMVEFGQVVDVSEIGEVTNTPWHYAPRVPESLDFEPDGDYSGQLGALYWDTRTGHLLQVDPQWCPVAGFSGQYGYNGPVMHASEFVGGGMARYMARNAGTYVLLTVESDCGLEEEFCRDCGQCDCEPAGWMLLERV